MMNHDESWHVYHSLTDRMFFFCGGLLMIEGSRNGAALINEEW
jgi:hypothetical protein